MTPERETELMDLKDRLLDAIHRVDELLCGGNIPDHDDDQAGDDVENLDLPDDDEDFDDDLDDEEQEELVVDGVVDPGDAGRKQKPIQYDLGPRRRDVAFKQSQEVS